MVQRNKPSEPAKRRSVRRCPFVASVEVTEPRSGALLSARTSELGLGGCYKEQSFTLLNSINNPQTPPSCSVARRSTPLRRSCPSRRSGSAIAQLAVLWQVGQCRWMGFFFQVSGSWPSWIRKDPNLAQPSHLRTHAGIRFRLDPIRHHGRSRE